MSAVDDRLRDKMPTVGTLPLLYNAVVVPKLLFEVVTARAKANVVYWKGLAAWLDRGRPLKPFYPVCGGKVSPSRAVVPENPIRPDSRIEVESAHRPAATSC